MEQTEKNIQNTGEKAHPGGNGPRMGQDHEIREKMGSHEKGKGMAEVLKGPRRRKWQKSKIKLKIDRHVQKTALNRKIRD